MQAPPEGLRKNPRIIAGSGTYGLHGHAVLPSQGESCQDLGASLTLPSDDPLAGAAAEPSGHPLGAAGR